MPEQPDIHLYTASTMNGWKPTIFLEEAGVEYELTSIDFAKKEQKSDWYLRLNPNGRIPTIVDRGNDGFVVFESGAILWYLAEKYGAFLSDDPELRSETLQWLMFQMAGIGPMLGQAMYFQRIAAQRARRAAFHQTLRGRIPSPPRGAKHPPHGSHVSGGGGVLDRRHRDLSLGAGPSLGQGFRRWP